MAGVDSNKVYLPSPDQSGTVGAVATAPLGTTLPTDSRTALAGTYTTGGYVTEDGISLSLNRSMTTLKDWSQASVRKAISEFDGTVQCSFLQVDEFAAKEMFGASNVTKTAANSTHGEQLKIQIGAELPDPKVWVWSMKDGNRRVRVVLPNAQVTEIATVPFVPTQGNAYQCTISAYPDATGKSIYIFYDDGKTTA